MAVLAKIIRAKRPRPFSRNRRVVKTALIVWVAITLALIVLGFETRNRPLCYSMEIGDTVLIGGRWCYALQ
jgi:hypothetical protein